MPAAPKQAERVLSDGTIETPYHALRAGGECDGRCWVG